MYLAIKSPKGHLRPLGGFSNTPAGRKAAAEGHHETVRNTAICAGLQGLHLQEWLRILLRTWIECELFQEEAEEPQDETEGPQEETEDPAPGDFVELPLEPGLLDALRCLRFSGVEDMTMEDEVESMLHFTSRPAHVLITQQLCHQGLEPVAIATRLYEEWRRQESQAAVADEEKEVGDLEFAERKEERTDEFEDSLRAGTFWPALLRSGVLALGREVPAKNSL